MITRMKNVAIVNTCDYGSTGKIAKGLFESLRGKGYHCIFAYGRGEKQKTSDIVRFEAGASIVIHYAITRIVGADGYGSAFVTKRLIKQFEELKIDTLYIVSLHGHYLNENLLFEYLVRRKIKVVYIMIDEYAYLGGCPYSGECVGYIEQCKVCPKNNGNAISKAFHASYRRYRSKKEYYNALKDPVFVGPEYTILASKKTGLLAGLRTEVLDEAVDVTLFSPRDANQLRNMLDIPKEKIVILCVAPYSYERKGVRFFYQAAKSMENDDRYIFVHVGYDGNETTFPSNMIVKGYEKDQETLACYYSLADLFVFPSLLDTMPNACLEALSCGTPLLCFDISGMPYIANDDVACFVEPGNVDMMVKKIMETKKKGENTIEKCRNYALERYDSRKYFQKLEELGK